MSAEKNLVLSKQQAYQAVRMNFYVNDNGIYQEHDLRFGLKWKYKVYFNNGLFVEDEKGNKLEKPTTEARISSDLRNATDEKTSKDAKPKRSKASAKK